MPPRAPINALKNLRELRPLGMRVLLDLVDTANAQIHGAGAGEGAAEEDEREPAGSALEGFWAEALGRQIASVTANRDRASAAGGADTAPVDFVDTFQTLLGELGRNLPLQPAGAPASIVAYRGDVSEQAHRILLCARRSLGAPLVGLAHLLAHQLFAQFGEAGVVIAPDDGFAGGSTSAGAVRLWQSGLDEATLAALDDLAGPRIAAARLGEFEARLVASSTAARPHLIFVEAHDDEAADSALDPRSAGNSEGFFHRIAWVVDELPLEDRVRAIAQRLVSGVRSKGEALYGTLTLSVLGRGRILGGDFSRPIERQAKGTRWQRRLIRDAHRLGEHPDPRGAWAHLWRRPPSASAGIPLVESPQVTKATHEAVAGWARALTGRRVGVALSGGGAASYRLVALLDALVEDEIPIDVISGVSGGAVVGAYYCARGGPGLDLLTERGLAWGWALAASILTSEAVAWQISRDLGDIHLEDLPVPLLALAVTLDSKQPQLHAAANATLAEAVQASGSLPPWFATMRRDETRYSDGGLAAFVPARALWRGGADFILSGNAVLGVTVGNPLHDNPWIDRFLELTIVGRRLVDLWASTAYALDRNSRDLAADAHEAIDWTAKDPRVTTNPLLEAICFHRAAEIRTLARNSDRFQRQMAECGERWRRVREPRR